MKWIESLRYDVVPSRKLSSGQHAVINRLLAASLKIDFPDRSPRELNKVTARSVYTRHNPNTAIGGPAIRKHQTYARSVNVLVYDLNDKLVAALPAADNASSRPAQRLSKLPTMVSHVAELGLRQAKLRMTEGHLAGHALIRGRWLWLGQPSLGEAARDNIQDTDPSTLTLVDGLVVAASYARDIRQPLSAYVYQDEQDWRLGLSQAGLSITHEPAEPIAVFGANYEPAQQEHMTAPSIQAVDELILAKAGAATILSQIRWQ